MKHYKSEFLPNFRMSSPPVENFLVTVLPPPPWKKSFRRPCRYLVCSGNVTRSASRDQDLICPIFYRYCNFKRCATSGENDFTQAPERVSNARLLVGGRGAEM